MPTFGTTSTIKLDLIKYHATVSFKECKKLTCVIRYDGIDNVQERKIRFKELLIS